MYHEKTTQYILSCRNQLRAEDILDQAVYEKVWMEVGDNLEIDVDHLIKQGRIKS